GLARLDAALEEDPSLARASQVVEATLRERRQFTVLANHYYRVLRFLGPENGDGRAPERKRAWAALGELCMGELGDRAAAQLALESAVRLDPADLDRRERLAMLYAGDAVDRAIVMNQELLRDDPTRRNAYAQLTELFFRAGKAAHAKACQIALA